MKKRILSFIISTAILSGMFLYSSKEVAASGNEAKKIDGSYLILEESSTGYSKNNLTRGKHMMDGECSISKAGTKRIYAFGSTTANHEVDYLAVIVYVDRYLEEEDAVILAEEDGDTLCCYEIYCDPGRKLTDLLERLVSERTAYVSLGFTPADQEGFEIRPVDDDDDALFVWTEKGNLFLDGKYLFPLLSHT